MKVMFFLFTAKPKQIEGMFRLNFGSHMVYFNALISPIGKNMNITVLENNKIYTQACVWLFMM